MINYDNFGPERIIKLYNPILGVKAVLCIDNTKLGPGKGGIRMTETVSEEEVSRLARAMTWKNALAELVSWRNRYMNFGRLYKKLFGEIDATVKQIEMELGAGK